MSQPDDAPGPTTDEQRRAAGMRVRREVLGDAAADAAGGPCQHDPPPVVERRSVWHARHRSGPAGGSLTRLEGST